MTAQRYLRYLPDFLAEYAEFQKLGEIEGEILEEEAKAKQEMEQDQWILTATRKGLLRRAVMMGLFVSETEDTETLRERVLSYWNSRRPYTFFMMQEWLDTFCGAGELSSEAGSWSLSADHCAGAERKAKEGTDFVILEDIDSGKSGL